MSLGRYARPAPSLALVAAACFAAAPATRAGDAPVVARHDDPALEWGTCPAFLPPGCAIAVLRGAPDRPNADVFLRIPAGADIAEHWHTSAERMVLVAGRMTVEYRGHPPAVLEAGQYVYGPARAIHGARCGSGPDCVLFIAFEQAVDAIPVGSAAP